MAQLFLRERDVVAIVALGRTDGFTGRLASRFPVFIVRVWVWPMVVAAIRMSSQIGPRSNGGRAFGISATFGGGDRLGE